MSETCEEWQPIPGFDGYDASTLGRIRSWRPHRGLPVPRIRKPQDHNGYPTLQVMLGREQVTRTVHQLVSLTFLGPKPEGLDTCHGDGNPYNNRPANLRYDTRAANVRDMQMHGTANYLRGEEAHSAKLTWAEVEQIRERYAAGGVTHRSLGVEYGVSHNLIGRIVRGALWRVEGKAS